MQGVDLLVKGSYYFGIKSIKDTQSINEGDTIHLKPEPDNRVDPDAVLVIHEKSERPLGHIGKNSSKKYLKLINEKKIQAAKIASIKEETFYNVGTRVKIYIRVYYESITYISFSLSHIPASPGVYLIKNNANNKEYIGSSKNMKERIADHIKQLSANLHINSDLQKDYAINSNEFSFEVLEMIENTYNLRNLEAKYISERGTYIFGYNSTPDGQGRYSPSYKKKEERRHYYGNNPYMPQKKQKVDASKYQNSLIY